MNIACINNQQNNKAVIKNTLQSILRRFFIIIKNLPLFPAFLMFDKPVQVKKIPGFVTGISTWNKQCSLQA